MKQFMSVLQFSVSDNMDNNEFSGERWTSVGDPANVLQSQADTEQAAYSQRERDVCVWKIEICERWVSQPEGRLVHSSNLVSGQKEWISLLSRWQDWKDGYRPVWHIVQAMTPRTWEWPGVDRLLTCPPPHTLHITFSGSGLLSCLFCLKAVLFFLFSGLDSVHSWIICIQSLNS